VSPDDIDAALWYQEDARYLYAEAAKYRDVPGNAWLAVRVQATAAASAALARDMLDIERAGAAS
jgi:hypothetical protein